MATHPRSPVIVVLGHVDHGKTSLLDHIRKSNLTSKEAGQITQSIGAYEVTIPVAGFDQNRLTFIDTPGHEAFSQLRSRGASVADIAVLIVDAVDSLKPQTIESIFHIKQAGIPYLVAVNKIDKPDADIEKVKRDLAKHEVLVEGMGGTVPIIGISATVGTGIPDLLETLVLIASEQQLTFDDAVPAQAYIIETKQTKAGIEASCIIKQGTMKVGQTVHVAGTTPLKIKALINDLGVRQQQVVPSQPFVLLGCDSLPEVGSLIRGEATDMEIKETVKTDAPKRLEINDLFDTEEKETLNIIIKADSSGSLEALTGILSKLESISIQLAGVGEVTKSDIFLAKVSKAIIVGFNTKISHDIEAIAKQERVIIKTYAIIYELLDELKEVAALMEEKDKKDVFARGEAKIIANFVIDGENIAGITVTKGKIVVGDHIELYRDDKLSTETAIGSLQQRAKALKEIQKGQEGGLKFAETIDFKVGDVIKSYSI
ncbi:MAG: Translation initiation factor IF-2 [Microgenomates bacterium OLB22]|nr:MAG: Translation initiation factor IF-2 [Microgenomates bacterium OLB22]